ncbi:MAG: DMT family transporter [Candidatus Marinimicrobia bacterium]|nr:DMT family transporter [Candidatus Neomarinimicrobiota bacterium]
MLTARAGELAALMTAVCWTVTSMSFESAGKRVGSLSANLIRLYFGFILLSLTAWVSRGMIWPSDATQNVWLWLVGSGVVGFLIGDLLLFKAFVVVGSRVSMLMMSLVPPVSALLSWVLLGEILTPLSILGMVLTVGGVMLVVLDREPGTTPQRKFPHPSKGVLFAFGGAVGQALGLIMSKFGMADYDALAATQIRVFAGIIGFTILFFILKRWQRVFEALRNRQAMTGITLGSVFGPFLGVTASLYAVQHTQVGIASTIMAIVPILIIPPAILIFKEKVTVKEATGAFIAVAGVTILFL